MAYNSAIETIAHIRTVGEIIGSVVAKLQRRAVCHDLTKLQEPEKGTFDKWTPELKGSTYGSPEYTEMLKKMKPALDHHYQENRHHPEHHENGVNDMDLLDLMEMLCDWKAATMRHDDGDIHRSLQINIDRFEIPPQIARLLESTIHNMGW